MTDDVGTQADRLLALGHVQAAVALIEQAGASGDADALFRHAVWKLAGAPLSRDLPGARSLLRQAAARDHMDAALIEIALTANGSGAPADWAGARVLLDRIAPRNPVAASHAMLLGNMALTADGRPTVTPGVRKIADHPQVWHVPGIFTPEELSLIHI